jgi:hypothetical protein
VHKDVVRGVRWLGTSPLMASFSSEKIANGYCNSLMLTDVRTRVSLPFRIIASEPSAMLGIRASVSGRYLLILLRAAPSEIWMVHPLQSLSPLPPPFQHSSPDKQRK